MSDDLNNKPLIEAIFEIRWNLPVQNNQPSDPRFAVFTGQLYEHIKERFPHQSNLPAAQMPDFASAHLPQVQFRTGPEKWPLIQVGAGILTINETEEYDWKSFKKLCDDVASLLFDLYPTEDAELNVLETSLRYIDADIIETTAVDLINQLKFDFKTPGFFNNYDAVESQPMNVNMVVVYPCNRPKGAMKVSYNQGMKGDMPAIIWETNLFSRGSDVADNHTDLVEWLNHAHDVTHDWFKHQIDGSLLKKYQ